MYAAYRASNVCVIFRAEERVRTHMSLVPPWPQEKLDLYGVDSPEVTVVYKDLTVTTRALIGGAGISTVVSPVVSFCKVGFVTCAVL